MWEEKTCIFFDDSFLHEAEHCGSRFDPSRAILLVDLWHPDIIEQEKDALNYVFPSSTSYEDHKKKSS
jgi:aspartyl/asparaginyl beta-hydroxylase (cupin superfamily)